MAAPTDHTPPFMTAPYDLIVIGAGSGGLAAAKRAASHGARVAIVEGDRVGGTCVIRGCVPKKLLVYGSAVRHQLADAASYGWSVGESRCDPALLLANVLNINLWAVCCPVGLIFVGFIMLFPTARRTWLDDNRYDASQKF